MKSSFPVFPFYSDILLFRFDVFECVIAFVCVL